MKNIEAKYRCEDLDAVRAAAERLGARDAGLLAQTDVFFHAPDARLKLRYFGDGTGELIVYRRADAAEARGSEYQLYRTDDPAGLDAVLQHALGAAGTVRKRRRLLLHEHTRIHLDTVEGLGTFVELETVVTDQTEAEAHAELRRIAKALGLADATPESRAYVDLLVEG
jgi:predicted adenylyl cyclase CyaB